VNSRNGYRLRDWDTRAGSIELAIPKLRTGSYFPEWLLERRRRAEQALVSVVATSYLLGMSTRRVEKLVRVQPGRELPHRQRLGRRGQGIALHGPTRPYGGNRPGR
jgi:transposase-like protein